MGIFRTQKPAFLLDKKTPQTMREYFFIKKGGKATWGDTKVYPSKMELICVSSENKANYIGNFAEGLGLLGVCFAKEDCRKATPDEVEKWWNGNWTERNRMKF